MASVRSAPLPAVYVPTPSVAKEGIRDENGRPMSIVEQLPCFCSEVDLTTGTKVNINAADLPEEVRTLFEEADHSRTVVVPIDRSRCVGGGFSLSSLTAATPEASTRIDSAIRIILLLVYLLRIEPSLMFEAKKPLPLPPVTEDGEDEDGRRVRQRGPGEVPNAEELLDGLEAQEAAAEGEAPPPPSIYTDHGDPNLMVVAGRYVVPRYMLLTIVEDPNDDRSRIYFVFILVHPEMDWCRGIRNLLAKNDDYRRKGVDKIRKGTAVVSVETQVRIMAPSRPGRTDFFNMTQATEIVWHILKASGYEFNDDAKTYAMNIMSKGVTQGPASLGHPNCWLHHTKAMRGVLNRYRSERVNGGAVGTQWSVRGNSAIWFTPYSSYQSPMHLLRVTFPDVPPLSLDDQAYTVLNPRTNFFTLRGTTREEMQENMARFESALSAAATSGVKVDQASCVILDRYLDNRTRRSDFPREVRRQLVVSAVEIGLSTGVSLNPGAAKCMHLIRNSIAADPNWMPVIQGEGVAGLTDAHETLSPFNVFLDYLDNEFLRVWNPAFRHLAVLITLMIFARMTELNMKRPMTIFYLWGPPDSGKSYLLKILENLFPALIYSIAEVTAASMYTTSFQPWFSQIVAIHETPSPWLLTARVTAAATSITNAWKSIVTERRVSKQTGSHERDEEGNLRRDADVTTTHAAGIMVTLGNTDIRNLDPAVASRVHSHRCERTGIPARAVLQGGAGGGETRVETPLHDLANRGVLFGFLANSMRAVGAVRESRFSDIPLRLALHIATGHIRSKMGFPVPTRQLEQITSIAESFAQSSLWVSLGMKRLEEGFSVGPLNSGTLMRMQGIVEKYTLVTFAHAAAAISLNRDVIVPPLDLGVYRAVRTHIQGLGEAAEAWVDPVTKGGYYLVYENIAGKKGYARILSSILTALDDELLKGDDEATVNKSVEDVMQRLSKHKVGGVYPLILFRAKHDDITAKSAKLCVYVHETVRDAADPNDLMDVLVSGAASRVPFRYPSVRVFGKDGSLETIETKVNGGRSVRDLVMQVMRGNEHDLLTPDVLEDGEGRELSVDEVAWMLAMRDKGYTVEESRACLGELRGCF